MKKLIYFALIVLIVGGVHYARAEVITFDNLTTLTAVPNGYGGLNWTNFYALDASDLTFPNGYTNGVVSPDDVAFNENGGIAFISPGAAFGTTFNFWGAYFTGVWRDGLSIEIIGGLNGNTVYDNTITVNSESPFYYAANYTDINELDFISYGGTYEGYGLDGTQFAMDNLSVPEPSVLILLGFGAAGLGLRLRRKAA